MYAAKMAIELLKKRTGGEGGLVLLDPFGRVGYASNTPAMSLAFLVGDSCVVQE
jgi:isoaspartyl peptidase/L-asparaginase-like protein (Ntn-hydrolase superfamily)